MAKGNGKSTAAGLEAFEQFTAAPSEALKQSMERAMSFAGDFNEIGRANMAAVAESVKVARKGAEAINTRAMGYMKDAMEAGAEATKTVTSAKSFQEAVEAQTTFAKTAFEKYVAELNAMAGLMSTTMKDAVEPINAQAGVVVEKLQAAS